MIHYEHVLRTTAVALAWVAMVALLLTTRWPVLAAQRSGRQTHSTGGADVPTYGYRVVRSYPHDRQAFTQGLVYHDGILYEGTGLNGRSGVRKVRLETGQVLQVRPLDDRQRGGQDRSHCRKRR